jgi:hypothetical protein
MPARHRRTLPGRLAAIVAVLALTLALATQARAQTATPVLPPSTATAPTATQQTLAGGLVRPAQPNVTPPGRTRTAEQVMAIADRLSKVRDARREHPGSTREAFLKEPGRWQVSYYDDRGEQRIEIAQVLIDDLSGAVLESWSGYQVPWTMARGYAGAFGRGVNSPWVWIPLCVLFALPFLDLRRLWRMAHLDVLVLTGFSIALAFFNAGRPGISTPLVVPLLAYLLVRLLLIGLAPATRRPDPLRLIVPVSWLAVAGVFLIGFRIGLNLTDSNVIDVGYAGVIGADHLTHARSLYENFPADNPHGNTYGPVTYLAYVPFETLFPWSGRWDTLPAAHAAALTFDLLCVGLLFWLGRRLRGPGMGVVLAYAWLAFPFTLFVSNTNANDALPALLVLGAVLAATSARGRGVLMALAALTKFAPLALVPLMARQAGPDGRPRTTAFAGAFVLTALLVCIPIILFGGSLSTFWDATLGYQADRGSPFAVYGLWGLPGVVRIAVTLGAVLLAVGVALVPRRQDAVGLAALAGAVLIAVQLSLTYWFFLYLAWILPLVLVALLARRGEPAT